MKFKKIVTGLGENYFMYRIISIKDFSDQNMLSASIRIHTGNLFVLIRILQSKSKKMKKNLDFYQCYCC